MITQPTNEIEEDNMDQELRTMGEIIDESLIHDAEDVDWEEDPFYDMVELVETHERIGTQELVGIDEIFIHDAEDIDWEQEPFYDMVEVVETHEHIETHEMAGTHEGWDIDPLDTTSMGVQLDGIDWGNNPFEDEEAEIRAIKSPKCLTLAPNDGQGTSKVDDNSAESGLPRKAASRSKVGMTDEENKVCAQETMRTHGRSVG